MRQRIGTILGLALTLVALLTTGAGAEPRSYRLQSNPRMRAQSFTLSGPCSGVFGGEIRIDGVSYPLSPDARIYEVGRGFLPSGATLFDRVVCVTGLRRANTLVVHSVLVRPEGGPAASAVPGGAVSAQEVSRPQ